MKRKTKRKKRTEYGIEGVRKRMVGAEKLILEGTVLSIDPSCISMTSKPGLAWFKAGELQWTGIIDGISPTAPLEKRLQYIGKYCREEIEEPDVLVIEHIVPGGKFANTIHSTIRATGAFISSFETEHVIMISPLAWQKFIEKHINLGEGSDYMKYQTYKELHKSDELDAKLQGLAILEIAKQNVEN